jgi:hypothetical protein
LVGIPPAERVVAGAEGDAALIAPVFEDCDPVEGGDDVADSETAEDCDAEGAPEEPQEDKKRAKAVTASAADGRHHLVISSAPAHRPEQRHATPRLLRERRGLPSSAYAAEFRSCSITRKATFASSSHTVQTMMRTGTANDA